MPFLSAENEELGFDFSVTELSPTLKLSNDMELTFGQIIALAGDYDDLAKPICLGATIEEREERFLAAFAMLDNEDADKIKNLIALFSEQRKEIELALAQDNNRSFAQRIDEKENIDYFAEAALLAYQTGHQLALKKAQEAHLNSSEKKRGKLLSLALQLEAFACHFLADLFSSGHIRTPHKALNDYFSEEIASLLSLFQQNEDSHHGLNVTNNKEEKWKAYGDGHLFEQISKDNLDKAKFAVESAVNEVWQVFQSGKIPDDLDIFNLIPRAADDNFSPMFMAHNNEIFYRVNLNDISCAEYEPLNSASLLKIMEHHALQYTNESDVLKRIEAIKKRVKKPIRESDEVSAGCLSIIFTLFGQSNINKVEKPTAAPKLRSRMSTLT